LTGWPTAADALRLGYGPPGRAAWSGMRDKPSASVLNVAEMHAQALKLHPGGASVSIIATTSARTTPARESGLFGC